MKKLNKKNKSRFIRIHILFQQLALSKMDLNGTPLAHYDIEIRRKVYANATKTKASFKRLYSIETLKELSEAEIRNLETALEQTITLYNKLKNQ